MFTTNEFQVHTFRTRYADRTCSHQMILNAAGGTGYGAKSQYIHAYVHRLRQKLNSESAELIQTVSVLHCA